MRYLAYALLVLLSSCEVIEPPPSPLREQRALELIDRGTESLRSNNLDEAWSLYSFAVEYGDCCEGHNGLAAVLIRWKRWDDAWRVYRAVLGVDPENSSALMGMAFLMEQHGDLNGAIGVYRRSLSRDPENVGARVNIAELYMRTGEIEQGLERWIQAKSVASRGGVIHTGEEKYGTKEYKKEDHPYESETSTKGE